MWLSVTCKGGIHNGFLEDRLAVREPRPTKYGPHLTKTKYVRHHHHFCWREGEALPAGEALAAGDAQGAGLFAACCADPPAFATSLPGNFMTSAKVHCSFRSFSSSRICFTASGGIGGALLPQSERT